MFEIIFISIVILSVLLYIYYEKEFKYKSDHQKKIEYYLALWDSLKNYTLQERGLRKFLIINNSYKKIYETLGDYRKNRRIKKYSRR